MSAPSEIAPLRRQHGSPPARYLRAVKLVVVFGAVLTLLTLFDASSETDGDASRRFLSVKAKTGKKKTTTTTKTHRRRRRPTKKKSTTKKEPKSASVDIDEIEWSNTTEAFLPVMTKADFKGYVDLFRSVLSCFHKNGLHLIPTGGTLVGTLRHKGMIPWDDDIDTYYFVKDAKEITKHDGPIQQCLNKKGLWSQHYKGNGDRSKKNIMFQKHGKRMSISSFPAYHKEDRIDFVSQNMERKRSPMPLKDIFPLEKHPFHDYHVFLPRNITKYIEVDWRKNQVEQVRTSSYEQLMSTVVSGHLHRGCKRKSTVANIKDVEFLEYYEPEDYANTLPFRAKKCHGRVLKEYEEYVQTRRLVAAEEARRLVASGGK